MKIGEIDVTPIIDGELVGMPAGAFPDKSPDDWLPYRHFLGDDGTMRSSLGSLLVRIGDRNVLIDAGGGPPSQHNLTGQGTLDVHDELCEGVRDLFRAKGVPEEGLDDAVALATSARFDTGGLPDALRDVGVQPSDITDVVFTHLHSDHIGWASLDGKPYFDHATYRCSRADLDYFLGPEVDESFSKAVWGTPSAAERLVPVLDRLEVWDGDANLGLGIDVRPAPGHTPGSAVVVLSSGAERAVLLGDMVHCPVELQDGEWQCIGDVDPVLARKTRDAFVRELEDGEVLVGASHFPGLRLGRLLQGEGKRGWVFA